MSVQREGRSRAFIYPDRLSPTFINAAWNCNLRFLVSSPKVRYGKRTPIKERMRMLAGLSLPAVMQQDWQ